MTLNDIHKKRITIYIPLLCATFIWSLGTFASSSAFSNPLIFTLLIFTIAFSAVPLCIYIALSYAQLVSGNPRLYKKTIALLCGVFAVISASLINFFGFWSYIIEIYTAPALSLFILVLNPIIIGIMVFIAVLLYRSTFFTKNSTKIKKRNLMLGCLLSVYLSIIGIILFLQISFTNNNASIISIAFFYLSISIPLKPFLKMLEAESATLKQKVFGITLYDIDSPSP